VTQPPEQRELILSILPELSGANLNRSFGGSTPFYLLFEAAEN
jgi:hypothetical protein